MKKKNVLQTLQPVFWYQRKVIKATCCFFQGSYLCMVFVLLTHYRKHCRSLQIVNLKKHSSYYLQALKVGKFSNWKFISEKIKILKYLYNFNFSLKYLISAFILQICFLPNLYKSIAKTKKQI